MLAIAISVACVAVLVVSAQALGGLLLSRLGFLSRAERLTVTLGVGLGALGVALFLLGLCGALSPLVILLGSAVLVGLSLGRVTRVDVLAMVRARPLESIVAGAFVVVIAGAAWLALYPPLAWDATMYHLTLAKAYARTHAIAPVVTARVPVFPVLNEVLFAALWNFGGDAACQLLQAVFFALCALTMYVWGRHLASPRAGWLAAAFALHAPMLSFLAISAYIDMSLAVYVALALFALGRWRESEDRGWLRAAAALAGFAAATKYTGLFFVAAIGVVVAVRALRSRRSAPLVEYALAATVVALPFYGFIYYHSGNPIFPYFFESNNYWSAKDVESLAEIMREQGMPHDAGHFALALLDVERHAPRYNTEAPLTSLYFYGLPLALLGAIFERRLLVVLALAVAYLTLWFFTFQGSRYLTVMLPLLSIAMAVGLARALEWRRVPSWMSTAAAAIIAAALLVEPGRWMIERQRALGPLPVGAGAREQFLSALLPGYGGVSLLNHSEGDRYRLYGLAYEYLPYFADGEYMGDHFGRARYSRIHERAHDPEALHTELRALGATHFLVREGALSAATRRHPGFAERFGLLWSDHGHRLYWLDPR